MRFCAHGGFELKRRPSRLGRYETEFWDRVEDRKQGLSAACGVYVFALKSGRGTLPWYVGKTERHNFLFECFDYSKRYHFDRILSERLGTPLLFLIARLTASGNKFSKPTSSSYPDVDFLESEVIRIALERNPRLVNTKKTNMLRNLEAPGIMNGPRGRMRNDEVDLMTMLGL